MKLPMSHESHQNTEKRSRALTDSFWFVLILAGLFIAAVNFIHVMSHDEGGHEAHDTTEQPHHQEGHPTGDQQHH